MVSTSIRISVAKNFRKMVFHVFSQLERAKADKEKAIRVLIKIAGKVRLLTHYLFVVFLSVCHATSSLYMRPFRAIFNMFIIFSCINRIKLQSFWSTMLVLQICWIGWKIGY